MKAARGYVLVQPVDTEETLGGGRIVLPASVRAGIAHYQCTVLDVGSPAYCAAKRCGRPHADDPHGRVHPVPDGLTVGAWVLVTPRAYIDTCHPTEDRYLVHQRDVEAIFRVT